MAIVNGTANADNLTGTASADSMFGLLGNDTLTAGAGNDSLDGGVGADTLVGEAGDDTYTVDNAGDTVTEASSEGLDTVFASVSFTLGANVENMLLTGAGAINGTGNGLDNYMVGNAGANVLIGAAGNDTLNGGVGADILIGGAGNDTFVVDNISDGVTELAAEGTDLVQSSVAFTLTANVENLTLTGAGSVNGTGNTLNNTLTGNAGNNLLSGASGDDTMIGGAGIDTYVVDAVGDVVTEGVNAGTDTIFSAVTYTASDNVENLSLTGTSNINATGNALNNILTGNTGSNTLDGGTGIDSYIGGVGNDLYIVDNTAETITEATNSGTDSVQSSATFTLSANVENLTLTGSGNINGTGSADNNTITGNSGNNVLTGGLGVDTLIGGAGIDTYAVDNISDVVTENASEGVDTIFTPVNYTISANVENINASGAGAVNLTGNAGDNTMTGNAGANVFAGGGGEDTMIGGAGVDTYTVDSASDVVTEALNEGTDTVFASLTYTLGSNVENLVLTGSSALDGTGNTLNNTLTGNSGNNTLNGGTGTDSYVGGAGDDVYIVDATAETITEAASAGTDSVSASVTYVLAANVENLTLTGSGNINGTGNTGANTLTGNTGNNVLDGGTGVDTLIGGVGIDTYVVDHANDVVTENSAEGVDTIFTTVNYTVSANVEHMVASGAAAINLTGNAGDNSLTGNAGNNTLDGAAGADTLAGGVGNDTYLVDDAGDVVTEALNAGTDTVNTALTFTLGANVENLVLTGSANVNGTGNALVNSITGSTGDNSLDGSTGNDTLIGLAGDDTYIVDSTLDVITEAAASGTDLVRSSATSYALSANVENIILTGSGNINATGNTGANTLTGNAGNNVLDGGAGIDTMIGGVGNDTYAIDNASDVVTESASEGTDTVFSILSYTLLTDFENLTLSGTSAINATGNAVANLLTGNTGNNTLDGAAGADTMVGGTGNDTYLVDDAGDVVTEVAGAGTDTVITALTYTLGTGVDNLTLSGSGNVNGTGNADANTITGSTGNNTLSGLGGTDTLIGLAGDDLYVVDVTTDVITEAASAGTDTVQAAATYTLSANVENLILTGATAINGTGNALDNAMAGNTGANLLDGGAGADTMAGGLGTDTYVVDNVGDVVTENASEGTDTIFSSISYTIAANVESLVLTGTGAINATGGTGVDTLTGNAGANTLDGAAGADVMAGAAGNDTYLVDDAGDTVTEIAGGGSDTVRTALTSYTLGANVDNLTFTGSANTTGTGNADANTITGTTGDNTLNGGAGTDTLIGLAGDDLYQVDATADVITEAASAGTDTVQASATYTLSANVENLILTGSAAINGTGNALDNTMAGNTGNNVLDGGAGADTMSGGTGNDTYAVDNAGDVVTENASEGTSDTVFAGLTYTLGTNFENLTLNGTGNFDATGNTVVNIITGNAGNNTLDGGTGADTLIGAAGNDVYLVDDAGDVTTEIAGGGSDTVRTALTWTLAANVDHLVLTGSGNVNGTGNADANTLTGNTGDNVLTGGAGVDTMIGGAGTDTYSVDNTADVVTELASEGTDTIFSTVTYTVSANVENLNLTGTGNVNATGNAAVNTLSGNTGNNTLDGGAGDDTMVGGTGNDTYIVDSASDVLTENASEGTDTVSTALAYTLATNFENLTLTGTGNVNGTGNAVVNVITGNAGNNTLDGAAGADTMIGGAGNDLFMVDDALDVTTELAAGGTDTVSTALTWTLAANVDHLILTGSSAVNGTGNADANTLTGNSGANTLSGLAGNDTMIGGDGNDTYVVDATTDVVTENASEGTDLVNASATFTLGANVENLTLTGTAAINATGNVLVNTLTGNTGNNTLDGGAGDDTMVGGTGNDSYIVDSASDVVTENASEGTDTVSTALTYTLGTNLENLILTGSGNVNGTGNTVVNSITGNSGNNTLDGGTGADTLTGGTGNDAYLIDNVADVIVETLGAGTDSATSSVTYTLSANVESLTLSGTSAIDGTGNGIANTLTGNSGVNTLDGGAGNDTLIGGDGSDLYKVDATTDVVTENASEGTDTVQATATFTLSANVENLTLMGTSAINGTGNTDDNTITGNSGANTLSGATGTDTLIGGAGNDFYLVDDANDVVTEASNEGTDTIQVGITYTLAANVENLVLTGSGAIDGTGNALDNSLTGTTGVNTLDGGAGADIMVGLGGNDVYMVDNSGDSITEAASAGTDQVNASASYTLDANVENLTLTGSGNISGTGNALVNTLTGNSGANTLIANDGADTLDGGTGADLMIGGNGDDLYLVDNAGDIVVEASGQGTDTVRASVSFAIGDEVDILELQGSSNINGTGGGTDNRIYGNSGNNTIAGGFGNDTYYHGTGGGDDVFTDADGTSDKLVFGTGLGKLNVAFYQSTNDLEIAYTGNAADSVTVTSQFVSGNEIDRFELSTGSFMTSTRLNTLIADITSYATTNSITLTSAADVAGNSNLMALINAAWS